MLLMAFRNTDDIRKRYKGTTGRGMSERTKHIYHFGRQPRPHYNLDIYTSRRCRYIQDFKIQSYVMEVKMVTKRKETLNALRTYIPENWRR